MIEQLLGIFGSRDLVVNIIAGVAATACIALLTWIGHRLLAASRHYRQLSANARILERYGVRHFIPSRADYKTLRGGETIAAYLGSVEESLLYVGFWHAKGIEMENMKAALHRLVDRGCSVQLVFLNPDIDLVKTQIIADFLGIPASALTARLQEGVKSFEEIKQGLAEGKRHLLEIRTHNEVVYSSCFIVDRKTRKARTLVDIKIYGAGRENTFAMELIPGDHANSLYERFTSSFLALRDKSQPR